VSTTSEVVGKCKLLGKCEFLLSEIENSNAFRCHSYGHRLASCVTVAYRVIKEMSVFINALHGTAQVSGNQVQNMGISTLSDMEIFDGEENLEQAVNRNFRVLLKIYLSYRERFDGFLDEVSDEYRERIRELIECDTDLETEFEREVDRDMARARGCVGENPGGEQTPAPTI
jgi:hypothetical protein